MKKAESDLKSTKKGFAEEVTVGLALNVVGNKCTPSLYTEHIAAVERLNDHSMQVCVSLYVMFGYRFYSPYPMFLVV